MRINCIQIDAPARSRIRRRLLAWYDRNRRDLPWRRRPGDAYAQMLAELMLQQTQVATVIGYFERFVARFPTVGDLARADINDVLALWSGLGYYSRARHLHAAARAIVEQHAGAVPSDVETLMRLPGIGRYTAGAIASIAYGRRVPVLDGNVARVLVRLLALREDPKSPAVREQLWLHAEALLPRERCGDFNQGLMELGATICRPKSPICGECPVQSDCRARALGLSDELPLAARKAKVQSAECVALAVRRDGHLLFVQRPMTGLWAGLWEFPNEPLAIGESAAGALSRLQERMGLECLKKVTEVGSTVRVLTHRRITFHVFAGQVPARGRLRVDDGEEPAGSRRGSIRRAAPPSGKVPASESGEAVSSAPTRRWLKPVDLHGVGISRACLAILKLVEKHS